MEKIVAMLITFGFVAVVMISSFVSKRVRVVRKSFNKAN